MSGRHTHHPTSKHFFSATVGFLVASIALNMVVTPALAHGNGKYRKARTHIVKRVRTQVGSPYRYGGSGPGSFDCSGLTTWTYNGHGAALPRTSLSQFYIPRYNHRARRIWKRKNLKRGDLVFHHTTSARVGHVGIYVGHGRFISTTSSAGVRAQPINDPYYWGSRWVGAVRMPITRAKFG